MALIFMDDIIIIKFAQNVQNKILVTHLRACFASCTILEVILEKPGLAESAPPPACLALTKQRSLLKHSNRVYLTI